MKLGDIEFVYSGRKDGGHRQGVGLMMNKEAAKSCLGWEGINNRILIAHFMTKKFRVMSYSSICLLLNRQTEILVTQMSLTYCYRSKQTGY